MFAVVACGFNARCALETDDGGQPRIEKLYEIIEACRFGIHDLSRVELDRDNNLPRFNMPLELGIFLGAKRFGEIKQRKKILLVQDTIKYRHQKFISDLAGMDVKSHEDNPGKVIANVHTLLKTNTRRQSIPNARKIQSSFTKFNEALPSLSRADHLDHQNMLFADLENLIIAWVKKDITLGS